MPSLQDLRQAIRDTKSQIIKENFYYQNEHLDIYKQISTRINTNNLDERTLRTIYKKMSLSLHSDKLGAGTINSTPFSLLSNALDVLNNPTKHEGHERQDAYFSLHFLYCLVCGLPLPAEPRPPQQQTQPEQHTSSYTYSKPSRQRTSTSSFTGNTSQSSSNPYNRQRYSSEYDASSSQHHEQQYHNATFDTLYNAINTLISGPYSNLRDVLLTNQIRDMCYTFFKGQSNEHIAQQFAKHILSPPLVNYSYSYGIYEYFCEKLGVSISKQLLDAADDSLKDFYISILLSKTMSEKRCKLELEGLDYLLDDLIREHGANANETTIQKFYALDQRLCQRDRSDKKLFSDAVTFAEQCITFGSLQAKLLRRRLPKEDICEALLNCINLVKPKGFARIIEAFANETELLKKTLISVFGKLQSPSSVTLRRLSIHGPRLLKETFRVILQFLDSDKINTILKLLTDKGFIEPPVHGLVVLLDLQKSNTRDIAVMNYLKILQDKCECEPGNIIMELQHHTGGSFLCAQLQEIINESTRQQQKAQQELNRQQRLLHSTEMMDRYDVTDLETKNRKELEAQLQKLKTQELKHQQTLLHSREMMDRFTNEELETKKRSELEAQYKALQKLLYLKQEEKSERKLLNSQEWIQRDDLENRRKKAIDKLTTEQEEAGLFSLDVIEEQEKFLKQLQEELQQLKQTLPTDSETKVTSRKPSLASTEDSVKSTSNSPGNSSSPTSKPNPLNGSGLEESTESPIVDDLLAYLDRMGQLKDLPTKENEERKNISKEQLSERKILEESLLNQWKNAVLEKKPQHKAGAESDEMSRIILEIFSEHPAIISTRESQDHKGYISAITAAQIKYREKITTAKQLQHDVEEEAATLDVLKEQGYKCDLILVAIKKLLNNFRYDFITLENSIRTLLANSGVSVKSAYIFQRKLLREYLIRRWDILTSTEKSTILQQLNRLPNSTREYNFALICDDIKKISQQEHKDIDSSSISTFIRVLNKKYNYTLKAIHISPTTGWGSTKEKNKAQPTANSTLNPIGVEGVSLFEPKHNEPSTSTAKKDSVYIRRKNHSPNIPELDEIKKSLEEDKKEEIEVLRNAGVELDEHGKPVKKPYSRR